MYKVGDNVVYGSSGVCTVKSIETPDFMPKNEKKLYYVLKPLYDECLVYAPVDTNIFMRPVISKEHAEKLIDMIPDLKVEIFHSKSIQELTSHYKDVICTHDCSDIIELIMSIYNKKLYAQEHQKKFGQVDERFLKHAEEILYGEFSVALGIPKEEVQPYIAKRVGNTDFIASDD